MTQPIRVGIIGAGWWAAQTHAPALRVVGGVEIVAACRRSPERLQEFADKVGVPQTFTNHEEMLDRVCLDAVVVGSPHGLHYTHIKAALECGLHVLTDKPLAVHTAEAEELIALAEARGVKLAVYFGPAYDPTFRYMAGQIRAGRLGRLVHIDMACFANPDKLGFFGHAAFQPDPKEFPILPTPFRADAVLGGGGYLQDMGSHAFSGLLIGTGLRVSEVTAVMDASEVDLRAVVSLKFTDGTVGSVAVIGDVCPPVEGYWGIGRFAVTGDRGTFWRDGGSRTLYHLDWGSTPTVIDPAEMPVPTNPDENFIRALRGEEELIAPASEAIECVRVIEAAYLSARTGRTVRIERD